MSNLGPYKWIVTASKKVGGPVYFLVLVGTAGAALYKGCELVVKKCKKTFKAHTKDCSTHIKDVLQEE